MSLSLLQQQMRVTRHRVLAKFGLMHMIGTNLSVWLNVLVQETKHEILTFYNPADNSIGVDKQPNHFSRKCLQPFVIRKVEFLINIGTMVPNIGRELRIASTWADNRTTIKSLLRGVSRLGTV